MKKTLAAFVAIGTICVLSGWGTRDSNVSGDKKQSINFYGTLETWASPGKTMEVENISIENIFRQIPMYVKPSGKYKAKAGPTQAVDQAARSAEQAAKSAKKAAQAAKKAARQQDSAAATVAADAAKAAQDAAKAATAAAEAIATAAPQPTAKQKNEITLQKDPKTSLIQAEIDLAEVGEIKVPFPDQVWVYQKDDKARKLEFIQVTIISNDVKKTKTDYLVEKWKKIYCDRVSAAGPGEQKVPLTALKNLKIKGYSDRELEESKRRKEKEREKIRRLAEQEASN